MPPTVLVFNAGSSSLKYAAFAGGRELLRGKVERVTAGGHVAAVREVLAAAASHPPSVVGHRVVHGGGRFASPVVVTPHVLSDLDATVEFAPLHQPAALAAIRAAADALPGVPQVACFDTAFHATLSPEEFTLPLPREVRDAGVRRYGFHGLSYEFIAGRLPDISPRAAAGRTVVCHLGSGASLCGMHGGRSVTTTMGFTPLDGLVMGTRPGRLDPGAVLHLLRHHARTADELEDLLERRCGLLGLSGVSGDVRDLLASADPAAALAVDIFCRSVAKEIAAAAVALGGLDAIVFTAGVGENSGPVRERVCGLLRWMGVAIDPAANADRLHAAGSAVEVWRLPTDEETVIARHAEQFV